MDSNGLRRGTPPAFNVPRVVIWLIGALIAAHLIRLYGPFSDEKLVYYFAFIPARLSADVAATAGADVFDRGAQLWSIVTYGFIHADWLHLAMNSFWMLAFGSVVARRLGAARFLLLSGIGAAAGALTYYAFHPGQFVVLVGASAAISAQVAVAARLMFARGGMQWSYDDEIKTMQPLSLAQTFTNRRSLMFILVWLGINYVFGATGFGTADGETPIAWEAHLGGFLAGLLIFGLIDLRNYPQSPQSSAGRR
jgi:membrane associated rhomboid family serine protease